MRYPFASTMIAKIGPSIGIRVELEPEYQFAGELVFPNGRRHLFRNTNFNINPAGSTEIAKDKNYTTYFLHKHGFNVPINRTFFSARLNANLEPEKRRDLSCAIRFAEELGFPVYIKPNNLSQGAFVTKAYKKTDIGSVADEIFIHTDVLLVEAVCPGQDYRVVVLNDKIISAYLRIPLFIVGDGDHTIDELLQFSRDRLPLAGRPNSEINIGDYRVDLKLREIGRSRGYIPSTGERITLLDNANLSTGGTSVDVTDQVHADFASIAVQATRTLGLRFSGVDILCTDISSPANNQTWNIIEINAAPGLDNYASMGKTQAERVEALYKSILEYLSEH